MSNNISAIRSSQGPDLSFLERPLPSRLPLDKDKIDIEELCGEISIVPIPLFLNSKENFLALGPICSNNARRPELTGIYRDSTRQCLVATNGASLVVLPATNSMIRFSEIVQPKTLRRIDREFPDYHSSIPFLMKRTCIDNASDFLAQLKGLARANRFVTGKMIYARLLLSGRQYIFNPEILLKVCCTLMESGTTSFFIEHLRPHRKSPD